jgi:chromosome segregation ATPase
LTPAAAAHDRAIAEVATAAIQALNARLEQAIGEVERLQDERLKLALQLGYAQAQLKACNEQLKALSAPAEPGALARLWRRLTGRAGDA